MRWNAACRLNLRGFTLVEVLVAITVLSMGSLGCFKMIDFFNRLRSAERKQTEIFMVAVEKMESFVENPPPCGGLKTLEPLPLAWIDVFVEGVPPAHGVRFRRLVKCSRKKDLP